MKTLKKKFTSDLDRSPNHPEVIGTMGQTSKDIFLVENKEEVKDLPVQKNQQIAYVTQTTLSVDDTKDIIDEIKSHFENVLEPKKKIFVMQLQTDKRQ